MNLLGRTAVISGGLGDIGRAIAVELAERGAEIALGDLPPPEKAADFLAELQTCGRRARYDAVDVTDPSAVDDWIRRVEAALDAPTIIVPNAAQVTVAGCLQLSPQQWRREMEVNLDGAFYMARSAAQRLVARRRNGWIVFIGSWAGTRVHAHIPAYSVTKAGLQMLCRCLALELAEHDILVNEVAPGYVDAGLSGRLMKNDDSLRARMTQAVPLKRLITPQEVARAVAQLCSPENRQITGATITIDGGLSLPSPRP